jgi:hypothetical protein
MNEAFIVRPGEGRHIDLGNFDALVLASPAQTSGEFMPLQLHREPPDFGPPLYLHRDAAEAFYVLQGESSCMWRTDNSCARPAPSSTCPGSRHTSSRWLRPCPARSSISFSPAAMLGFLRSWPRHEYAESERHKAASSLTALGQPLFGVP